MTLLKLALILFDIKIVIKENCPAGCPCDTYECEDVSPTVTPTSAVTTTTEPVANEAVLLLSIGNPNNVPMVIGYNGK